MGWGRALGRGRGIASLLVALTTLCVGLRPVALTRAQSAGARVPILSYHAIDYSNSGYSVTPEQLDAECTWLLQNGYTFVTL
jgi:hypothetical protein